MSAKRPPAMKNTLLYLLFWLATTPSWGQMVVFRQDFSSSTAILSYVSASPSVGQFNQIATTGANADVRISAGTLELESLGGSGSTAFFNRTSNFYSSGSPAFLIVQFDFQVLGSGQTAADAASFFIGSGFPQDASIRPNSEIYARLGFRLISGSTNFELRNVVAGVNGPTLSGRQRVTLALNNSGATVQYFAPAGGFRSLANDQIDVWANTTLVFAGMSPTTPTQNLDQMRFTFQNTGSTIQLDNFLISDDLKLLPVELAYFLGRMVAGRPHLEWQTVAAEPKASLEVQRSGSGLPDSFATVGQWQPAPGSQHGQWADGEPLPGYNYYRLRLLAPGEPERFSPVVVIRADEGPGLALQLGPNPATDWLEARWAAETTGLVYVYDALGRVRHTQAATGTGTRLAVGSWPAGTYFFTLQTATGHQTRRFVKQ
jgi:hypothetical protein